MTSSFTAWITGAGWAQAVCAKLMQPRRCGIKQANSSELAFADISCHHGSWMSVHTFFQTAPSRASVDCFLNRTAVKRWSTYLKTLKWRGRRNQEEQGRKIARWREDIIFLPLAYCSWTMAGLFWKLPQWTEKWRLWALNYAFSISPSFLLSANREML